VPGVHNTPSSGVDRIINVNTEKYYSPKRFRLVEVLLNIFISVFTHKYIYQFTTDNNIFNILTLIDLFQLKSWNLFRSEFKFKYPPQKYFYGYATAPK
jgi:hypothetical protein